jgi:hypothetical protein
VCCLLVLLLRFFVPFPIASVQIDVTGVPPGTYLLRIELNVLRKFVETTVENNVGIIEVIID